jgi:hypothetical protein
MTYASHPYNQQAGNHWDIYHIMVKVTLGSWQKILVKTIKKVSSWMTRAQKRELLKIFCDDKLKECGLGYKLFNDGFHCNSFEYSGSNTLNFCLFISWGFDMHPLIMNVFLIQNL